MRQDAGGGDHPPARPSRAAAGIAKRAVPAALLAGAALAIAPEVAAAERLEARSRFEVETFYYGGAGGDDAYDWAGVDAAWSAIGKRWSLSAHLPVVRASGSDLYVGLGPGFAPYRKGADGGTSGSGASGGGPRTAAAVSPAVGDSGARWGIGDVRLQAGGWLNANGPHGRFRARGGVKIPTADEAKGLGTGKLDAWAGFGWRREGFTTDVEVRLDWVYLGDPDGAPLRDGPAAGVALGWTVGRGSLWLAADGARSPFDGEADRWIAGLEYARGAGAAAWSVRADAGLTSSAPDFGLAVALRF